MIAFLLVERAMKDEALLPLTLFQERTVAVASGASVLIGMAMFGGLASLPLYLQIVKGASPTKAGLLLLPLTLGIMFGSIVSGQIISRTGRYRRFPIIGSALLAISLFVFHYIKADTPLWQTSIVMVFFGLGLGFNFQPLTLAVQNAVSPRLIGVATASATFTRQIGGTLGTAVFLSILFSTVPDKITAAMVKAASGTKEFQAPCTTRCALRPGQRRVRQGTAVRGRSGRRDPGRSPTSSRTARSSRPARRPAGQAVPPGFSDSMDLVFLVGAGVMVLGFLVMLLLPHVELRGGSAYSERGAADKADAEQPRQAAERGRPLGAAPY